MNKLKKYLILAAMICLAAVLLSSAAYAENSPVYLVSNETYYDSLQEAYNAASSDDTIVLCDDIELTSRFTVSGKNITITDDGNPHNIFVCNADSSQAGGYGRAIQVNSGSSLTISATVNGNLSLIGHSRDGSTNNAAEIIYVYKGTVNLNNLIIKDNSEADISAYTDKTRVINLNNVSTENILLPAGCTCSLNGTIDSAISLAENYNPIAISSNFSNDSNVTVSVDTADIGDVILKGNVSESNCGCFNLVYLSSSSDYKLLIGSDGKVETLKVASYVNTSNVTVRTEILSEAITNAKAGTTVTVLADCEVSSRILIDKNLSISDNGKHHTIYVYNSDTSKDGGYGRAIQLQNSKTLTVSGTPQGGLTFIGHEKGNSTKNNKSSIIYVYTGTLTINGNVEITDCHTTYGVIYAAKGTSVNLDGCHIHGNVNTHDNGGTAVYNLATLNIKGGTVIEDNSATSAMSGAIYNEVSDSNTAKTHLSGNIIVQNNLKCCTKQENEDVAHDGKLSNIQLSSPDTLVIENDISGNIGIDYSGDENGVFGKTNRKPLSGKDCLSEDGGNYSTVTYDIAGNLYWHLKYSISGGDITDKSKYSYKLGNASVNMTSTSDTAGVSITADCGSFTVPSIPDGSTFVGIKYDNSYTTEFSASDNYRGISVNASFDEEGAQNFIKSLTFTTPGENMPQKVSIGLYAGGSDAYFGGSFYSYCGTTVSYEWAGINAANSGRYLASVSSASENSYIFNRFRADGWLGATLQSNMWCWTADPKESVVITSNPTSSEGYNGAYTNWAESEPNGSNSCVYLSGDSGRWKTSDGTASMGYYLETIDACAAEISNSISVEGGITKLNALAPSFDGDIAMYYYFSFAKTLETGRVTVKVGGGELVEYSISDIIAAGLSEYGDYGIKVSMAAKQMNDTVEIKIFDNEGHLVCSYGGEGRTNYNLRYYAQKVIKLQSNGGSDKYNESFSYDIVKFVKAMLNYGAAAQAQFGYNTANPANAGYEDGIFSAPTEIDDTEDAVYKTSDSGSEVFTGAALVADSTTKLRIYFSNKYNVTVDGSTASVSTTENEYYVDIPVNAQNLSHIYSINANEKNLQINTYYVINELLKYDASSAGKLTAYKLYRFGKAADSYFGVNVLSASAVEAVVNTAYAYLNKAQYIQYDQATIVNTNLRYTNVPNWRRQVGVYPEEAADEVSNLHMDCSSFVWNVYCNAFGTENVEQTLGINRYDISTSELVNVCNGTLVVKYDLTAQEPDADDILSVLQPGDLLVKRKESKMDESKSHGHVVIWVGNGYIHCTGSSYSYNDESHTGFDRIDADGAIKYASADAFSEAWWSGFETLVILRPMNVLSSSDLASYGQARSQLGGISVSKTAYLNGKELYDGLSVNPGDTVEYKITVSNPSVRGFTCAAKTVNIEDTDPGGNVHSFTAVIGPDETADFDYEYEIPAGVTGVLSGGSGMLTVAGGQGKTGTDDGRGIITFSAKSVAIENEVSQDAIDLLIENATEGQKQCSGVLYINDLMTSVTGMPVTLAASDNALFTELFKEVSSSGGTKAKIVNTDMSADTKSSIVSNYASGRMVINRTFNGETDEFSTCRRVRKITTDNLQLGDIVAVNPTGGADYIYYVYLGGQEMLQVSGNVATKISDADTVLDGLLAKYSFAVLRVLGRV